VQRGDFKVFGPRNHRAARIARNNLSIKTNTY
jgi:hypothetical protein